MAVQMIGREIQEHADIGTKLFDQLELKAAQLRDGNGFFAGFFYARDQRRADVARKNGGESGAPQNVFDERGRGRFPVGPGDTDEPALQETVGKLNLAPDRDAF